MGVDLMLECKSKLVALDGGGRVTMRQMRGRGLSWAWAAVTLVLAIVTCAHAASSLDAIRARGVLRVGIKTDAPPFGAFDESGRHVGFEIDLARFFARVLFDDDSRAQLVPVTTGTRFEALQTGRVDLLLATVTATEERRSLAELSEPYFISASLVLVAQESRLDRLSDAAGQRVAVVKGSIQERDVAELQSRAMLLAVGSVEEGAYAVKSGQADAFVYDDVVVLELAQRDVALRVTGAPIRPRPYVIAARKGDTGLIQWVNGWLAKMRRDGSYSRMWRRYFGAFESRLIGG
jgi:polar amino acid transport system substrate-binding protein